MLSDIIELTRAYIGIGLITAVEIFTYNKHGLLTTLDIVGFVSFIFGG